MRKERKRILYRWMLLLTCLMAVLLATNGLASMASDMQDGGITASEHDGMKTYKVNLPYERKPIFLTYIAYGLKKNSEEKVFYTFDDEEDRTYFEFDEGYYRDEKGEGKIILNNTDNPYASFSITAPENYKVDIKVDPDNTESNVLYVKIYENGELDFSQYELLSLDGVSQVIDNFSEITFQLNRSGNIEKTTELLFLDENLGVIEKTNTENKEEFSYTYRKKEEKELKYIALKRVDSFDVKGKPTVDKKKPNVVHIPWVQLEEQKTSKVEIKDNVSVFKNIEEDQIAILVLTPTPHRKRSIARSEFFKRAIFYSKKDGKAQYIKQFNGHRYYTEMFSTIPAQPLYVRGRITEGKKYKEEDLTYVFDGEVEAMYEGGYYRSLKVQLTPRYDGINFDNYVDINLTIHHPYGHPYGKVREGYGFRLIGINDDGTEEAVVINDESHSCFIETKDLTTTAKLRVKDKDWGHLDNNIKTLRFKKYKLDFREDSGGFTAEVIKNVAYEPKQAGDHVFHSKLDYEVNIVPNRSVRGNIEIQWKDGREPKEDEITAVLHGIKKDGDKETKLWGYEKESPSDKEGIRSVKLERSEGWKNFGKAWHGKTFFSNSNWTLEDRKFLNFKDYKLVFPDLPKGTKIREIKFEKNEKRAVGNSDYYYAEFDTVLEIELPKESTGEIAPPSTEPEKQDPPVKPTEPEKQDPPVKPTEPDSPIPLLPPIIEAEAEILPLDIPPEVVPEGTTEIPIVPEVVFTDIDGDTTPKGDADLDIDVLEDEKPRGATNISKERGSRTLAKTGGKKIGLSLSILVLVCLSFALGGIEVLKRKEI